MEKCKVFEVEELGVPMKPLRRPVTRSHMKQQTKLILPLGRTYHVTLVMCDQRNAEYRMAEASLLSSDDQKD